MLVAPGVQKALLEKTPVVALESALITHGLPYPRNAEAASQMQSIIEAEGATAAMVAVIDGSLHVGLTAQQQDTLARTSSPMKIGVRDLPLAAVKSATGGTTVAATMFAAHRAGIEVFATGGIGGVHRESPFDISADIPALAKVRMIVVCAGAKAILDLRATLELLETMSVSVIGYGTDDWPAFYSRTSGLGLHARLDSPSEVAAYWARHCALGMNSAVLVANPIPAEAELSSAQMGPLIATASREAQEAGIRGKDLTPFLLSHVGGSSDGRTVDANLALLKNNARVAAQIAAAVAEEAAVDKETRN
jgi:pseudouridine-5'-phosphate glycosidase